MIRNTATEDYYRRFGLDGDPFPIGDDDDLVLFLTPELEHRLALIQKCIEEGRTPVIVTGPPGSGKTRLATHIGPRISENWITARIFASGDMDPASLAAAMVGQVFPESECGPDEAIERLQGLLDDAARSNGIPVLVIDDAHRLPVATLAFIIQLAQQHRGEIAFRFVLFADERIHDRLEDPGIGSVTSANICSIQLPALTEQQTAEYLRHRILSYGHIRRDPFGPDTIVDIHRASGGLPGGIHFIARQVMLDSPAQGNRGKTTLVAAGLLAAAVAVYLLLPETLLQPPADVAAVHTTEQGSPATPPATGDSITETMATDNGSTDSRTGSGLSADAVTPPDGGSADTERTTAASGAEAGRAETAGLTGAGTSTADSDEPAAEAAPAMDAQVGGSSAALDTGGSPPPADPRTARAETPPPARSPLSKPEQPAAATPAAVLPEGSPRPHHANVFDLADTPDWAADIRGQDWLRSQPENSVLLQIISAAERDNVKRLVLNMPELPQPFAGFTNYTPSGKPRYRLYYGVYPDTDSAATAAAGLPPELRSLQPWPRPLADIIEELDNKKERFGEKHE